MKEKITLLIAILGSTCAPTVISQIKVPDYAVETGSTASSGSQAAFWTVSNQYGYISTNPNSGWIRPSLKTNLDWDKRFDYSYGLDVWARYDGSGKAAIQQGYIKGKMWFITIYGGRMEEHFGNQDTTLSSGGFVFSNNAMPMPKIAIQVEQWTPVPYTLNFFEFKGGVSNGWFGKDVPVSNYYLLHQNAYVRFGGQLPFHILYGFHHFAQWGGKWNDPKVGNLPSDFKDFVRVFLAKDGSDDTSANTSEKKNKVGNHIGWRNFGIDMTIRKTILNLYYQQLFEDINGQGWRNITDGLWGISIHSNNRDLPINGFTVEYIHTTDQSGPNWSNGGNDNYFNHGIYVKGWTYQDMTIGTPFITSPALYKKGSLQLPFVGRYILNNRVKGMHIGIEGKSNNIQYRFLYSNIINYGDYSGDPNDPTYSLNQLKQHYFGLDVIFLNQLPWNIKLTASVGADVGYLLKDDLSGMIKISKCFNNSDKR